MDPITHILSRSDMYIGSPEKKRQASEWIMNRDDKFEWAGSPVYSDGLWRIFMEPISNVIDNVWRSTQAGIECKRIAVDVADDGKVVMMNDGQHISIEKDEATGLYNPELIFGNLLTSSNYDDTEERLSSGRNGLGVKLTNVFSLEFTVECGDPEHGVVYHQKWSDHMRKVEKCVIRKKKVQHGYTRLTFQIDLSLFGYEMLDDTITGLFRKTCADMAMITHIPVVLNGKKIHIRSFKEYVQLFPLSDTKQLITWNNSDLQKKTGEQLEVVICPSFDDEYHEIGFVNGIYTREGGCHVDTVANEFFKALTARLNKNRTTHLFTSRDVKPHFLVCVNAVLINPTFSNQSKTRLNSPAPVVAIDPKMIQTVCTKWGFMEKMNELLKSREMLSLRKTEKKARGYRRIEGLDHANKAGSKDSKECTLILCEGLSAKTYAVTGIEIGWNKRKGRDYFGVFALRGKLLNVRNATTDTISGNKEIASIIQALNLRYKVDYTDDKEFETLTYGRVMIITDADVDGLHIASLILNMFHVLFPSLLKREFLYWMMTPVAKIFQPSRTLTFYNDFDYQNALKEMTTKFTVKYYKGLGTSSDEDVRQTFGIKVVSFQYDERADDRLDMVFSKTTANDRKRWMERYDPLRYTTPEDRYAITTFIDQEHVRFSIDDCKRNIPNLYDSMKLSQRKILYAVMKKGLVATGKSMKVAQLAGYVAETSNYHHGEQCLYDTITRMAQDFVGANNCPLLAKDGQFGSRTHGGKDAANGRYIFTKMLSLTRAIFPKDDDELVPYTLDDGDQVEPDYYTPILPMILVNGCKTGIGSGWSCHVPPYHPLRLLECVRAWLHDPDAFKIPDLIPYYHGFKGKIERIGETKFRCYGVIEEVEKTGKKKKEDTHRITEIPIDTTIEKYKDFLEKLMEEKKLKSLKNYSSPNTPLFHLTPQDGFHPTTENMNLTCDITVTNMVLFTDLGKLKKYDTIHDIFVEYCRKRLSMYGTRRERQLSVLKEKLGREELKLRFVRDVVDERLVVFKRKEAVIVADMEKMRYPSDDISSLLTLPVRQLTSEYIETLEARIASIRHEIRLLEEKTPSQIWLEELNTLSSEFSKIYT